MEIQMASWWIFTGCSAFACILWFFLDLRLRGKGRKALPLSLLVLSLGILLGTACARGLWVLFLIYMHPPLFPLRVSELSYYGGMAGVLLAVVLSAKILGCKPCGVLNIFAPMGAFLAAAFRFAEGFLGSFGFGTDLDHGIFFPLTVEIPDEFFPEYYLAVFMMEGVFSLIAMAFSLVHGREKDRWLRTLFYLCLPQILFESLRLTSIRWLFIHVEQLLCVLLCEGVLVYYALKAKTGLRSWLPALSGLLLCGLFVAVEFALENKISFGGQGLPHWLLYTLMAAGLAGMAAAEHRARSFSAAGKE